MAKTSCLEKCAFYLIIVFVILEVARYPPSINQYVRVTEPHKNAVDLCK